MSYRSLALLFSGGKLISARPLPMLCPRLQILTIKLF